MYNLNQDGGTLLHLKSDYLAQWQPFMGKALTPLILGANFQNMQVLDSLEQQGKGLIYIIFFLSFSAKPTYQLSRK